MKKTSIIVLFALFIPACLFAKIGVGVGTGKIVMDEPLKAGGIYDLHPLSVINTGDQPGDYAISVEYHEQQPQGKPESSWFIFSPDTFHLEPGGAKVVNISLRLPVRVKPGEYFAYLEAHPAKQSKAGETTIGVAAASKLYFSVAPANIFQALYHKSVFLFREFYPWSYISSVVAVLAALLLVLRRFFTFNLGISLKK